MASITQRFLVPVSAVSARNAWHNGSHFCTKYNENRVADIESRCLCKRDLLTKRKRKGVRGVDHTHSPLPGRGVEKGVSVGEKRFYQLRDNNENDM